MDVEVVAGGSGHADRSGTPSRPLDVSPVIAARRVPARHQRIGRSPEPSGSGYDESAVMRRVRDDPQAFGELYEHYADPIFRFVHGRLRDRTAAEDVTSEVFFKALRAIDTYRPEKAPFAAWLFRIAANAVVDHVRSRRPTVNADLALDVADTALPVADQVITLMEVARIWEVVDALADSQRTAVTLRFGHDLPIASIAQQMQRSEGAVKLLLNRALRTVRTRYQGDEGLGGRP